MKGCSCKERERERSIEKLWVEMTRQLRGSTCSTALKGKREESKDNQFLIENFCQKQIRVQLFIFTLLKIFPVEFQYFSLFSSIDYCIFLFFAFHKID